MTFDFKDIVKRIINKDNSNKAKVSFITILMLVVVLIMFSLFIATFLFAPGIIIVSIFNVETTSFHLWILTILLSLLVLSIISFYKIFYYGEKTLREQIKYYFGIYFMLSFFSCVYFIFDTNIYEHSKVRTTLVGLYGNTLYGILSFDFSGDTKSRQLNPNNSEATDINTSVNSNETSQEDSIDNLQKQNHKESKIINIVDHVVKEFD